MTIAEQVYQQTQTLPQSMQVKTLHYVEFLGKKTVNKSQKKKLSDLKGKIAFSDGYDYKKMRKISNDK